MAGKCIYLSNVFVNCKQKPHRFKVIRDNSVFTSLPIISILSINSLQIWKICGKILHLRWLSTPSLFNEFSYFLKCAHFPYNLYWAYRGLARTTCHKISIFFCDHIFNCRDEKIFRLPKCLRSKEEQEKIMQKIRRNATTLA